MLTHWGSASPQRDGAAPGRTRDLTGLPPLCLTVGALDLFLEENLEYVRRLTHAGVAAELHVIRGAYHGYAVAQDSPQVVLTGQVREGALRRAFGG